VESEESSFTFHFPISTSHLFVFFMQCVATAAATILFELQPVRRVLFVLCRHVIALFALRALQNNVISGHITSVVSAQWSVAI
jgi:hypothetical protein